LKITSEKVLVTARFHEQGSVLRGDAEGFCDGFDVEIQLESTEPVAELDKLVRLARRMCFTENALTGSVPVEVRQTLNGVTTEL
jgi:organic hydroperoxide reductase OsmC/OhrA